MNNNQEEYLDIIANSSVLEGNRIVYMAEGDDTIVFTIIPEDGDVNKQYFDNGYYLDKHTKKVHRYDPGVSKFFLEDGSYYEIFPDDAVVLIDEIHK